MLHEILFSLLGKTGNIIIESESKFSINENLDFISASEREIINRICILGYYYSRLEKFLEANYKSFSTITSSLMRRRYENEEDPSNSQENGGSGYVKAFCFGLEEVLDEYREIILKIEDEFLQDRVFTISALNVKLSKYFYILPELCILVIYKLEENIFFSLSFSSLGKSFYT